MTEKRKYDSSIARMAGNIAAGLVPFDSETGPYVPDQHEAGIARIAVSLARAIVAEVQRTEPSRDE